MVSLTDIVRYRSMPATDSKDDDPHEYYIHTSDLNYSNEEIESLHLDSESLISVRDIMTPRMFTVSEEAKIRDVADAMIRGNIHRVLVTRNNTLVGIITSMDMLRIIRDF